MEVKGILSDTIYFIKHFYSLHNWDALLLDYTERKFEQDCNLIEDLANDVLQNIHTDLQIRR